MWSIRGRFIGKIWTNNDLFWQDTTLENFYEDTYLIWIDRPKGQQISKASYDALNSSKRKNSDLRV
jgi:hypothetical protein